ncbi:phenylalanine--tRNA ligase subunit beta, partial [Verrucomicrobiota bacterium]
VDRVEDLAERLTFSGLEVENIEVVGSGFEGIVVAEILGMDPHPGADNVSLCRIHNGQADFQVVCGATNFSVGDKVLFAGIGTTLPNGQKIEPTKIRGKASGGMLCAEDELGLSDDHSGLMILPRDLPAGRPFSELMGPPEPVLTIEVTPNRGDCLSVIGIAREVAALYGRRLKLPAAKLAQTGKPVEKCTKVRVEDTDACPRYTARIISDIKVGPSPLWMRTRLIQCGVRPINNVVDITNYVMLESGEPMHAFDQALLDKGRIVVRRAKQGERITTLEGVEYKLSSDMLVIADAQKPVALAGVMGGESSGILDTTRTVLLESAFFKPSAVRKVSKTLGVSTESSYRFEHGVDIQVVDWASRRAASLMVELAGGTLARGVIDVFPKKPKPRKVVCRFERVRKLLGIRIMPGRVSGIFESLGLKVTKRDSKACTVRVPTFRPDLKNEADLIEEVARLHGLEKIPTPSPRSMIVPGADDSPTRAAMICRSHLAGLGLSEIMNYSFVSEDLLNLFGSGRPEQRIILPRPISADQAILRDSLLPQMGETLGRNRSRQIEEAAFFEMGRVFFKNEQGKLCEEERLSVGLMGPVGQTGLGTQSLPTEQDMFLWLKGILQSLCSALSIQRTPGTTGSGHMSRLAFRAPDTSTDSEQGFTVGCFEKNRTISIFLDGSVCGIFGLLKQSIRNEWRLRMPVAVLETRLQPFLQEIFSTPA